MKIGILQCDHVRSELQPKFGNYPEMFATMIHSQNPRHELLYFAACDAELPDQTDLCEAYILTGSASSVYEDLQWIRDLESFVRCLHQQNVPTVGICFGHQLLAQALGGETLKSPKGWGVGIAHHRVVGKKDWMIPKVEEVKVLVSHQDQVTKLPPQAQRILQSEFCPNAMFQHGEHIIGCQGHPEFTPEYSRALMLMRKGEMPETVLQAGLDSLTKYTEVGPIPLWIENFLKLRQKL
jgi:GMP synthase-like glutamine amidotransferase